MKRLLNLGLLLIIVLTFFSCKNQTGSDVTIGFLIHSTTSSRWQMDISYVEERAAEVGATIILKDAGGDENMQLAQANELLEMGVDALIVVAANQNTAAGIVREAHDYNVPVIAYDRLIKNSDLDYLVSFEYERVGELMVEYVADNVENGNCVILWGDASDANAVFVKKGHENAMNLLKKNNIKTVYKTFIEDWTYENAYHQMNTILDFYPEKIDAVIACNDPLGIGASDALREHGYKPGEVIITGQDATLEFVHSMLDGGITMSVGKPIKELAYGAIDLVVKIVKEEETSSFDKTVNNGRKDVPAKLFSPYIIDETNFEKILIEGDVFTRDQVFIDN
ncbi:MAG: substrate-binding domain-containing protein [Prolixibacteraceae bacterium]|nr:substrate-binding domain-containing protein [Prolixibacteraceae bacterium]